MIIKAIEVVSVAFLFVMALQWTWTEYFEKGDSDGWKIK